jgi:hypothetical protein
MSTFDYITAGDKLRCRIIYLMKWTLLCKSIGNQTCIQSLLRYCCCVTQSATTIGETQLTLTEKSADSGLIGLKRIPYNEMLIE